MERSNAKEKKEFILNIRVDEDMYDYLTLNRPRMFLSKRVRHLIDLDRRFNIGDLSYESND